MEAAPSVASEIRDLSQSFGIATVNFRHVVIAGVVAIPSGASADALTALSYTIAQGYLLLVTFIGGSSLPQDAGGQMLNGARSPYYCNERGGTGSNLYFTNASSGEPLTPQDRPYRQVVGPCFHVFKGGQKISLLMSDNAVRSSGLNCIEVYFNVCGFLVPIKYADMLAKNSSLLLKSE